MNAWILLTRSATLRNEPRLIARWLSNPNHRSTWFNQDAEVGVKCRWKRGCAAQGHPTLTDDAMSRPGIAGASC